MIVVVTFFFSFTRPQVILSLGCSNSRSTCNVQTNLSIRYPLHPISECTSCGNFSFVINVANVFTLLKWKISGRWNTTFQMVVVSMNGFLEGVGAVGRKKGCVLGR